MLVAPSGTIYVATGGSTTAGELLSFTPQGPGGPGRGGPGFDDPPADPDPVPGPLPVAGALLAWRLRRAGRKAAAAGSREVPLATPGLPQRP